MEGDEVVGTRAQLHQVLDDVDLIARQLISCINNSNHAENRDKMAESRKVMDVDQLARLLSTKQGEIQELLRVAGQQKQLKDDVTCIKQSIVTYDKRISNMQRTFNEAERLQATSVYHAKQLIKKIDEAQKQPVGSEDLVKYAHKISSSCSTVAPITWTYGDPRRPYPMDVEMKVGWLGQINNMATNEVVVKPLGTEGITLTTQVDQGSHGNDKGGREWDITQMLGQTEKEEVDLMSSDSSSSDSSDSDFMD